MVTTIQVGTYILGFTEHAQTLILHSFTVLGSYWACSNWIAFRWVLTGHAQTLVALTTEAGLLLSMLKHSYPM